MIVGYDWGGYNSKLCAPDIIENFPSDIIPDRIKVENDLRKYDFIVEYKGVTRLAGQLARDERTSLDRNRRGDSKFHKDALIRLLIGLHQFVPENRVKVVVGQPISRHREEKELIKDMLVADHTITVNDVTKTITIEDAAVAAEGASAWYANPTPGIARFIDVGSGTINLGTVKNKRFISNQSGTLTKGIESSNYTYEELTETIRNVAVDELEWNYNDPVYLVGGGAKLLIDYVQHIFQYSRLFNPLFQNKTYPPDLANAIAFYEIGELLWPNQ